MKVQPTTVRVHAKFTRMNYVVRNNNVISTLLDINEGNFLQWIKKRK